MPCRKVDTRSILTILVAIAFAFVLPPQLTGATSTLSENPVVREKAAQVLTDRVRQYLEDRDGDTVKVWVFFTDKQVYSKSDFQSLASSVTISERALRRRAKVGMDKVVFADLPVSQSYADRITGVGAKLRRVSKWLNAASFEVSRDLLDEIADLPFVASVKPVIGYKKEYPVEQEDVRLPVPPESQAVDALSYGESYGQLNQINIPALHDLGYAGQGVTLAVFDTGYRKSHEAFAQAYLDGRVLAEWDFIFDDGNTANEGEDVSSQWNHGTSTWSIAGGMKDGKIYGPAYEANFILAKTEDLRSETPVEEDNWVAALEWVDSIGADVVTSSLGYIDWYTYADKDGQTAVTTIAANTADSLGIVLCNSVGNEGPNPGTLNTPSDAFNILSTGAVNINGLLASFSSRGSTYDGRTKPEVCAMGVNNRKASAGSDASYSNGNGTSYSCPLVAATRP
jgi:subtilisin family serine protease